ncbi:PilZ domain-containing protein [Methylobacterium sp. 4-46]|uniref:PilZ domain-containing protein n=1 Tax=unclassified Methylobacterium TaxID=2615210 RepID=UPI0012372117
MRSIPRPPRIRVCLTGQAGLNDDAEGQVICFLLNLSDEGACLSFADSVVVPACFSLVLGPGGETHRVEVRWQEETTIGVRFSEPLSREMREFLTSHLRFAPDHCNTL